MANNNLPDVDPSTVEVIRNYLTSAAGEMHRTLVRTAHNAIIYELLDFGITLYDNDLNLIADSPGLAAFIGANDHGLEKGIEHVGKENINPGDVFMLNYPYWSAGHTNDVLLFSPIHYENNLIGYSAIRAHWGDVGGKDPGFISDSTSMYQEGFILPAVKVRKEGELDEEILDLIRYNTRMPRDNIGNLNAQLSAINVGSKRLRELYEKYGKEIVEKCIKAILESGEQTVREEIKKLPNGTWSALDYIDDDGINDELYRIEVEATIDDDEIIIDYTHSSDEAEGPINSPIGLGITAAKLAMKALTVPDKPSIGGHFRPLTVVAPPGNIFHATDPAPVQQLSSSVMAADTILQAFAKGMPERLPAGSAGDVCPIFFFGSDETGANYVQIAIDGLGWGGSINHDGANSQVYFRMGCAENLPTELLEIKTPLIVERHELRKDSGGPGKFRGGLGPRRDFRATRPLGGVSVWKKTKTDNWGAKGGKPGARNEIIWFPDTNSETRKSTYRASLKPGDRISARRGGGGGYGNPYDRDPEKVRGDVQQEYISPESARNDYGVEISSNGVIDWDETQNLRSTVENGETPDHLNAAKHSLANAASRAEGKAGDRLNRLTDLIASAADREHAPDPGRISRLLLALEEVEPIVDDETGRTINEARNHLSKLVERS